jgi:exopolyphosphatase/guanosine-5'-triphosphate,3'-diphosphate pyrophosphatase
MLFRLGRPQKPTFEWRRIAILDLGSNTARLIIMRAIPGYAYRLEDEIREMARLHVGMTDKGLSEEAMERALSTLKLFKRFSENIEVDQVIATATSAVREAANGTAFIARVRQEVGWDLQILSGEREAYYGCIGVLNETPLSQGYIMDIGGGSMQISTVLNGRYQGGASLRLGALALTERFVRSDPASNSEYDAVRREIRHQLDTLRWVEPIDGWRLVGLGSTIRNLAKIESKRQRYPLNTLHGFVLSRDSVAESIKEFTSLPLKKRKDIPGLSTDRADIILPGAMVVLEILDRLKLESMTISENGLREGVFFEQFWKDRDYPVADDVRRFSVLNMARVYNYHEQHAEHVQKLVRRLFTQLVPLHGYGPLEQGLLESAALLHDLGTIISYSDHHKHSQMLITNSGIPGYSPREVALIALMARYHRKGTPGLDEFEPLMKSGDERLLTTLSALLRMAEYLERGRAGAVSDVDVHLNKNNIVLDLIASVNPAVEMWDAERNALPLFEEAYERETHITCSSPPPD